MIPKKLAPDLIRGGYPFSEKILAQQKDLAPPAGFEPASTGLKDRGPVPLDEGGNVLIWSGQRESNPRPTVWKTATLPLSYTRANWRRVQESNLPDLSVSSR